MQTALKTTKGATLRELQRRITALKETQYHPDVIALMSKIKGERQPEIELLEKQADELRKGKKPVQRWPEDTPNEVLKLCRRYWQGTTEFDKFRIHMWNDRAIWTSYPAGAYTDNGGSYRFSPSYRLISRTKTSGGIHGDKPLCLISRETPNHDRLSKIEMEMMLREAE